MLPRPFLSELGRKTFHVSWALLVPALFWLPRQHALLGVLLGWVLVATLEIARLVSPGVATWFEQTLGGLFRTGERKQLTGVFWMATGVLAAVLLLPDPRLSATALLYGFLADPAASLVGQGFGGPKLFGRNKTWSGTLACLLVSLAIGACFLLPEHPAWVVLAGAVICTAAEILPLPINDNLAIPVLSALFFRAVSWH